jgi:hypothetical protein
MITAASNIDGPSLTPNVTVLGDGAPLVCVQMGSRHGPNNLRELLVTQGHHGIDADGPPRRDVART